MIFAQARFLICTNARHLRILQNPLKVSMFSCETDLWEANLVFRHIGLAGLCLAAYNALRQYKTADNVLLLVSPDAFTKHFTPLLRRSKIVLHPRFLLPKGFTVKPRNTSSVKPLLDHIFTRKTQDHHERRF